MINPDGKVEVGHWKRDRLVQPDQDEEQYMDHTKSFLMGDRYTPRTMDAEVVGPAEVREAQHRMHPRLDLIVLSSAARHLGRTLQWKEEADRGIRRC